MRAPCDACGCTCGEAPEEDEEVGASPPLLCSETGRPGDATAPPPSTDISILWEEVRSEFAYTSDDEQVDRYMRCMLRGLFIFVWLFVVDILRMCAREEEDAVPLIYVNGIFLAMYLITIWNHWKPPPDVLITSDLRHNSKLNYTES